MLEIKHTLCPSCSVGCGINVVSEEGDVVGTYPYKRHPVNEGKNCLNGRNSIYIYKNKLESAIISNSDAELDKAIDEVCNTLKSKDSDKITVFCSGNNSIEDIEAIKAFAESNNYNVALYADNFVDIDFDVASYDDVENASSLVVVGDILYTNPLIGRRIIHAKNNEANIYSFTPENSVTANVSSEIYDSLDDALDNAQDKLDESSVILFNVIESSEQLDKIKEIAEKTKSKILPVYSKCNSKGASNIIKAQSKEEFSELLSNTDVLLIFNDDLVPEVDFDFASISDIVSFTPCENSTSKASKIVVPIKSWLENDGSFVNAMGETQTFKAVIESDALGVDEVIEKIQDKL
jgi:formate dehydrogenase major subunit